MTKDMIKKRMIQYIYIAIGVILLDFGFYFFTNPANLVFGGMMGISILLEPYYTQLGSWFTNSIFLFIANGIALVIGGIMLGKDFFLKTIFSSLFSLKYQELLLLPFLLCCYQLLWILLFLWYFLLWFLRLFLLYFFVPFR